MVDEMVGRDRKICVTISVGNVSKYMVILLFPVLFVVFSFL